MNGIKRIGRMTRHGNLLVAALVCLAIATTLMFGALRTGLLARRQLRQQFQLEQSRWLLDAGVRHAKQMLRDDADYDGETFSFDSNLPHNHSATLKIEIEPANKDEKSNATLTVSSKLFRDGSPDRVIRRSESFTLPSTDRAQP